MNNTMGIINLYEEEEGMKALISNRTLGAVPYGGRYRLIDFQLSNMVNSGIVNVGVFASNNTPSLMNHLGIGEPWGLNRKKDGLFVFYPSHNQGNIIHNEQMESFRKNLQYLEYSTQKYVIITSSHMVYSFDFQSFVDKHIKEGNDVTILYKSITNGREEFLNCEILDLDGDGNLLGMKKNVGGDNNVNISLDAYVMEREFFIDLIKNSRDMGVLYSLNNIISVLNETYKIKGFCYDGYVQCVNSVSAYFKGNLELLEDKVASELFKRELPIHTRTADNPPTRYGREARVKNSYISNGAIIEGIVENSIVFRGVKVDKGAVVKDSILMTKSHIGEGVRIQCAIADKYCDITKTKDIEGAKNNPIIIEKNTCI
ncbi:glucose-1-phosphate adenylyltransferase subunit GlgD [Clostridium cellulovorans]|uniref:Glucose-1-phosphate adenylyltransferase, GlgD subunit n=1 Tax=Clostridium cellulovorans (strain ATCC 35296 / DSM 3052 / OCM 3 / 743B) TaxID=573061 RepID=D9SS45_CLOC7|nr:glucose-1-phosphate adenylyltransferase subunit GlgD [Clostridium cellulovorans]ADL52492.1 glucose-1-phosphate adenylyltransferase, GlgD subunit [Clostridium cellulovorans 743B]